MKIKNELTKNVFEDLANIKNSIIFPIQVSTKIENLYEGIINSRYPIFVLKSNDNKIRKYQDKRVEMVLKPSSYGLATIFDKDVWIYSILELKKFFKNDQEVLSSTICFAPCKFFSATYRNSGGKNYHLLKRSLSRLKGTVIEISIFYPSGKKEIREISFINSWKIKYKKKIKLYSEIIELDLPNWVVRFILSKKKIKFFNKKYYSIRKAIIRRLYEIVDANSFGRKKYSICIKKLHLKVGTASLLKIFKYKIKKIEQEDSFPGYFLKYDRKNEIVNFIKKK